MGKLEIITKTRVPKGLRPTLRAVMRQLTKNISSEVCIILTNDAELRALKLEFWGEDASTDVLSFPQWEPGDPFVPAVLGDIVISVPTAQQQAETRGHSLTEEVVILAAHGLTHLLGFDHQTQPDWEIFHEFEQNATNLLTALNLKKL